MLRKKPGVKADSGAKAPSSGGAPSEERIIARIPQMPPVERQILRANCRKLLKSGTAQQKASAKAILARLDELSDGAESEGSAAPRASRPRRAEFRPDKTYETLPGVAEVLHAVDAKAKALLVLGRAGTGKTTLVKYLRERPGGDAQAIVAPTGIAAQNAGAQTIHSFFQLPPALLNPDQLPEGRYFGPLYKKMTRLVIDEISMVRADLLDAVDMRLQQIRSTPLPFGGVQVLMVGDFLQLPPVVQDHDRRILAQLGYDTPFAFSARVFKRVKIARVSLDKVFRQNEQDFIELLGKVRSGIDLDATLAEINARCVGPHRNGPLPLMLTSTLAAAERYNAEGLGRLKGEPSVFAAETKGKTDGLQIPASLLLKPGARVMATRNDQERRWTNGSLGTVTTIKGREVHVRFDHSGEEHHLEPVKWEKIRQVWNEAENRIDNEVIGAFEQLPLMPAWAITIHKAQGLTLDDVRIDFGAGAFAPGQVYVALSRVRTLDGLSLTRPLRAADFHIDPLLQSFIGAAA